jgi:hypothetical protein
MRLKEFFLLLRDAYPFKRPERSSLIHAFIIGVIFLGLLWLASHGYPWILFFTLFSLFPFVIINMAYMLYMGWKSDRYLQKNYFEIWKMGKSVSFIKRLEHMKLANQIDDPHLDEMARRNFLFSKRCFWIWLCLVLVGWLTIGILYLTGNGSGLFAK